MADTTDLINKAVAEVMTPDFVKSQVASRVQKLVVEAVDDALRSYSDIGKQIKEAVKASLAVNDLNLPSYGLLVTGMIEKQVTDHASALIDARLAEDIRELLNITVRYVPKNYKNYPPYRSLDENCFTNGTLPSISFGFSSCSQKWKIEPQNRWTEAWPPAVAAWNAGSRVIKLIGYDCSPADAKRYAHREGHVDKRYVYGYLLAICERAMRTESAAIMHAVRRLPHIKQAARVMPFLDGMADRLAARIRAMIPPQPTGRGLVVLRNALITEELARRGVEIETGSARRPMNWGAYRDGQRAGDGVALNPGVEATSAVRALR